MNSSDNKLQLELRHDEISLQLETIYRFYGPSPDPEIVEKAAYLRAEKSRIEKELNK